MRPMSKTNPHIAALAIPLLSADDGALQLFPAGVFNAERGALRGKGPWRIDAQSAARLIAAVAQRKNDIMIDYDHQLLLAATNGQKAVAAGWIGTGTLEWRDAPDPKPGLYAQNPRWTAAAVAHIAADEYRYQSPVFSYDANTGDVLDIINVALTNNPAIDDMQPVTLAAASALMGNMHPTDKTTTEHPMEQLLQLLGLAADADMAAACGAIEALQAKASEQQTQIAALSAQADSGAGAPDPAKYVPIGAYHDALVKLAALSGESLDTKVAALVEDGFKNGKIIGDGAKQWATELGKKDIAALSAFLDQQPGIAALTGMQTQGKAPPTTETAALSATPEEIAVAKQLGISVDDIVKQRSQS